MDPVWPLHLHQKSRLGPDSSCAPHGLLLTRHEESLSLALASDAAFHQSSDDLPTPKHSTTATAGRNGRPTQTLTPTHPLCLYCLLLHCLV